MHPNEVDQRLTHYRDLISQWSASLYELDEHATYRLLAAGDMYGVTGDRANNIVSTAPALWSLLGLLRNRVEDITKLVEESGVFNNQTAEIERLVTEKDIPVSRLGIPNDALTSARAFIADGDEHEIETNCDGVVVLFRKVYEPIRAVVADVDAVWRDLMPRIEAATSTLDRAKALCARLSTTVPEVRMATQRLEAVRASVSDDPLSLSEKVGPDLDALVASAARAAGALEHSHGSLSEDLANADQLLAELRVLRARAAAAYSEAMAKVVPDGDLIRVPSTAVIDGKNGLAHRSRQFDALSEPGSDWREARKLVDEWQASANRLKEQLEKALNVNASPLAQRSDMRSLLRAYRVKASMISNLPADVADLGQVAHDELYTAPTDLGRAKELINRFATQLTTYGGRT